MYPDSLLSERRIAASLLIACGAIFAIAGILYSGRAIWKWPSGQTDHYLRWERGFVILAVLATALGLALLDDLLRAAGDVAVSRLGMVTYLVGAVIIVVAEASYIRNREWVYPQIVLYVVLAFLAQAAFGAALVHTGLVAAWIGWATIIWNLAWLLILPLASRRDLCFPVLHHTAPVFIGIALLAT